MVRKINYILLFLAVVVASLTIFGLVMLYSTTATMFGEEKLKAQCIWILFGVGIALILYRVDYRILGKLSHIILFLVSVPLFYLATIYVMTRFGVSNDILAIFPFVGDGATKGAYRWLKIGNRTIQPSEFAKVAIIIFLARYYGTNPRYILSFRKGILEPMAIIGVVLSAILLGGSLSVTIITGAIVTGILFAAGIRLRYIVIPIVLGAILVGVVVKVSPERASRFTSYRNPEKFKDSSGYQLYSSQLALGSGHWYGIGFNESRMKAYYLPESHTDFIMAIVGEELGFMGVLLVIILYMALVTAAVMIGLHSVDREGMLLAFGIGSSIGLHAFINIAVVSGFVPTTGITAPLISYGGSNMIMTWACIGLLSSIARISQLTPEAEYQEYRHQVRHENQSLNRESRLAF